MNLGESGVVRGGAVVATTSTGGGPDLHDSRPPVPRPDRLPQRFQAFFDRLAILRRRGSSMPCGDLRCRSRCVFRSSSSQLA